MDIKCKRKNGVNKTALIGGYEGIERESKNTVGGSTKTLDVRKIVL